MPFNHTSVDRSLGLPCGMLFRKRHSNYPHKNQATGRKKNWKKTFRIYLSLLSVTCLVKMTTVFFQSIGKSVRAAVTSLVRDIVCFTPLAIFLSAALEINQSGSGINGIPWAAPLADMVAAIVIVCLTVSFFRKLKNRVLVYKTNCRR